MAARKKPAKKNAEQLKMRLDARRGKTVHKVVPWVLGALAVFLLLCYLLGEGKTGTLGEILKNYMTGVFSLGAYFLPLILLVHAVLYKRDLEAGSHGYKFLFSFLLLAFLGTVAALFAGAEPSFSVSGNYTLGKTLDGGGVVGGFLHAVLCKLIGKVASWIVSVLGILVFGTLLVGTTPARVFRPLWLLLTRRARAEVNVRRAERRTLTPEEREEEEKRKYEEEQERVRERIRRKEEKKAARQEKKTAVLMETDEPVTERRRSNQVDQPLDIDLNPDEKPETATPAYVPPKKEIYGLGELEQPSLPSTKGEEKEPEPEKINYQDLFADVPDTPPVIPTTPLIDEAITVESDVKAVSRPAKPKADGFVPEKAQQLEMHVEPAKKEYRLPPLELLPLGKPLSAQDDSEQQATAKKLVDTLLSFGVKTRIVGISRGPRVTRYELQPEAGVRVRSIVNSADDIALALASSGVRIEAPVPGKEAAGVEVPNRTASSVYLRNSIDTEEFRKSKSKILCCLGLDISGKNVYCDLAKMPHLLVAGTTGSGKSVCLHSMILSILYHATPEEVQFIMVDPKNVEFSVYNGIPHMLVPMLSDPKKAAGALNWAVIEMEKRYVLLGEEGARDIDSYNEMVRYDPDKKPMSRIVIVIDELADLMMVARDEVETSICRIAQKARAAGMHLVIGTQRPSVDVITGVIKANIPSRIALNVASQVDSRTMIDTAGAEKLLGKGDLLYKPVGALSPIRLQGSFTDEKTIRSICDFLRAEKAGGYDESVMNQIEREAQRCGEKKKGSSFAAADESGSVGTGVFDDKDDLLEKAIEICIAEKKFSTSLLQRRLSIGYGRAAKLGDLMAELNVIGPYNGSKPREVVWTQEFFNEYRMRALEKSDE